MKMKTLALLSLSLAVALALPALPPGVEKSPVLTKENQLPLLGDSIPLQGHVQVENPAPQAILPPKEQQEKEPEEDLKQNMAELEVKVKPDEEQEVKVEPEPEAEVEKAGEVELEVKVKPEVKVEEKSEAQQEVEAEVPVEAEAQMLNAEAGVNPEGEGDQELKDDPEFQVESEVKVEPDQLLMELEPEEKHMLDEENYQEPMQLQADPGLEEEKDHEEKAEEAGEAEEAEEESHNDMVDELEALDDDNMFESELTEEEKAAYAEFQSQDSLVEPEPEEEDEEAKNEMVDEPIMELEPLDDSNPVEPLPEEDLVKNEVANEPIMELEPLDDNSPAEPLPEEELFMRKRDYALDQEPVMELEPEMMEEPFQNPGILEEGPALDIMEQPVSLMENYFPNEEAKMAVRAEEQESPLAGEENSLVQLYGEPETEDQIEPDDGEPTGLVSEEENQDLMEATKENRSRFNICLKLCLSKRAMLGQRSCPGVVLGEKCYQFFKEPKTAANAELFCQKFPGGHLASITSTHNHAELMKMIVKENGKYTRTWVGGLRFLDTGRFIWLDGSKWDYTDWLSGEPNNTANKENCLEVLPYGNGKFNDFTCWEPQAFICSYYN
ncbi:unnamed protein product [Oreochromis niloticus]|nr:unnamed protein product [Mustela putorius furo]